MPPEDIIIYNNWAGNKLAFVVTKQMPNFSVSWRKKRAASDAKVLPKMWANKYEKHAQLALIALPQEG